MGLKERFLSLSEVFKKPQIDREFAISEESIFRNFILHPFTPDKLLQRKGFQIYEQMEMDDQIAQSLCALKLMRLSTGGTVVPASEDVSHVEHAEFVQWNFDNIEGSWNDDIWEILGALQIGWSLGEKVHTVVKRGRFEGKIALKAIKSKRPSAFNILLDEHDNILPLGVARVTAPQVGQVFPSSKFVIYSWRKRYENVFGTSILRSLYDLWWIKHILKRALGVYMERFGMPLAVGHFPPTMKATEQNALFKLLKSLRLESVATIPKDIEVKFQEASGRGPKIFIETIKYIDDQITKTILGQTLTTSQGSQGSQALGRVHKDVLTLYLDELGEDVATKAINPQIIRELIDINFGPQDVYPKWEFNDVAPQDKVALVDKMLAAKDKGFIIVTTDDEKEMRSLLNLPERTDKSKLLIDEKKELGISPSATPPPPNSTPTEQGQAAPLLPPKRDNDTPADTASKENGTRSELAEGSLFTGVNRRSFTDVEKRVDFQEMLRTIEDNGTGDITDDLAPVLEDAIDKYLRKVQRQKIVENQDFAAVKKLKLDNLAEMKKILREGLVRTAKRGNRSARQELSKARKQGNLQDPEDVAQFLPKEIEAFYVSRSFDITGVINNNVLEMAKNSLLQSIKNGLSFKAAAEGVRKAVEPFISTNIADPSGFVSPDAATGPRMNTIVRTNVVDSFNLARREEFLKDTEFVRGFQYSAILDDRVRTNHARMDGRQYLSTDSVWDMWTPVNGFNCRCTIIAITAADGEFRVSPPIPGDLRPDRGFGANGT